MVDDTTLIACINEAVTNGTKPDATPILHMDEHEIAEVHGRISLTMLHTRATEALTRGLATLLLAAIDMTSDGEQLRSPHWNARRLVFTVVMLIGVAFLLRAWR